MKTTFLAALAFTACSIFAGATQATAQGTIPPASSADIQLTVPSGPPPGAPVKPVAAVPETAPAAAPVAAPVTTPVTTPATAQTGLQLTYNVSQKTKITSVSPESATYNKIILQYADEQSAVDNVITLLPDTLVIRAGNDERIYDFARKVYTVIDHKQKIYNVMLLHTLPLARSNIRRQATQTAFDFETETQTGKMVKTMSGVALDTNGPLVDLDALYAGASDNKSAHLIRFSATPQGNVFDTDGGRMASYTNSQTAIPPELMKTYLRFLVYGPAIHPDVEKQMGKTSNAFDKLEYTTNDHAGRVTKAEWKLAGAAPATTASKVPDGYTEHFSLDDTINAAMTIAQKPGPDTDYFSKKVKDYLKAGDPLHALLALHEALLSLPAEETKALDDLTLQVLMAGGGDIVEGTMLTLTQVFTTRGDIDLSNKALIRAKKAAPDYTHLLDVFRARNIHELIAIDEKEGKPFNRKEFNKSIKMYMNAITANPWLATAYADLGDGLFGNGDSMLAWTCWQEAVRMKPDLSGLKKLTELKATAEKQFPEYF
jgi:tetratricopeptide (TPR) repeat protein